MTTPEQILIDGLKYINTYDLAGDDALADCTLRQRAGEFLEAYNEAKAKEAGSSKTEPTDLLTASPDRTALLTAWPSDVLVARPLAEALNRLLDCKPDEEDEAIENAMEALTQYETLIKQSEAVWAVVEEAKTLINRLKVDCDDDKVINETFSLYAAIEALEMMEGEE